MKYLLKQNSGESWQTIANTLQKQDKTPGYELKSIHNACEQIQFFNFKDKNVTI